jgi:ferredoxin
MNKEIKIQINTNICDLCGTCVGICPENIITMTMHNLIIDHDQCTRCKKCIWICPVHALNMAKVNHIEKMEEVSA